MDAVRPCQGDDEFFGGEGASSGRVDSSSWMGMHACSEYRWLCAAEILFPSESIDALSKDVICTLLHRLLKTYSTARDLRHDAP